MRHRRAQMIDETKDGGVVDEGDTFYSIDRNPHIFERTAIVVVLRYDDNAALSKPARRLDSISPSVSREMRRMNLWQSSVTALPNIASLYGSERLGSGMGNVVSVIC